MINLQHWLLWFWTIVISFSIIERMKSNEKKRVTLIWNSSNISDEQAIKCQQTTDGIILVFFFLLVYDIRLVILLWKINQLTKPLPLWTWQEPSRWQSNSGRSENKDRKPVQRRCQHDFAFYNDRASSSFTLLYSKWSVKFNWIQRRNTGNALKMLKTSWSA